MYIAHTYIPFILSLLTVILKIDFSIYLHLDLNLYLYTPTHIHVYIYPPLFLSFWTALASITNMTNSLIAGLFVCRQHKALSQSNKCLIVELKVLFGSPQHMSLPSVLESSFPGRGLLCFLSAAAVYQKDLGWGRNRCSWHRSGERWRGFPWLILKSKRLAPDSGSRLAGEALSLYSWCPFTTGLALGCSLRFPDVLARVHVFLQYHVSSLLRRTRGFQGRPLLPPGQRDCVHVLGPPCGALNTWEWESVVLSSDPCRKYRDAAPRLSRP